MSLDSANHLLEGRVGGRATAPILMSTIPFPVLTGNIAGHQLVEQDNPMQCPNHYLNGWIFSEHPFIQVEALFVDLDQVNSVHSLVAFDECPTSAIKKEKDKVQLYGKIK